MCLSPQWLLIGEGQGQTGQHRDQLLRASGKVEVRLFACLETRPWGALTLTMSPDHRAKLRNACLEPSALVDAVEPQERPAREAVDDGQFAERLKKINFVTTFSSEGVR